MFSKGRSWGEPHRRTENRLSGTGRRADSVSCCRRRASSCSPARVNVAETVEYIMRHPALGCRFNHKLMRHQMKRLLAIAATIMLLSAERHRPATQRAPRHRSQSCHHLSGQRHLRARDTPALRLRMPGGADIARELRAVRFRQSQLRLPLWSRGRGRCRTGTTGSCGGSGRMKLRNVSRQRRFARRVRDRGL